MGLRDLLFLMRPQQWYKNLLVFLAPFFSGSLAWAWQEALMAFAAFSLMSSANYIINDLFDLPEDRHNPEKARPLVTGAVRTETAVVTAVVLFMLSLVTGFTFGGGALLFWLLVFFLLTFAYSAGCKRVPYLEFLCVSANFVIRAIGGAVMIQSRITPWLIAGTFTLAFFIIVGKRRGELLAVSAQSRHVLRHYSKASLAILAWIAASLLSLCFVLYALFTRSPLLWSMPLFIALLVRLFMHVQRGSVSARHPHYLLTDPVAVSLGLVFMVLVAVLLHGV